MKKKLKLKTYLIIFMIGNNYRNDNVKKYRVPKK